MRKTYANAEMIQVHQGHDHWIWIVFDGEGEQIATGTAPSEARAMALAGRHLTGRRTGLSVALTAAAAVVLAIGMNALHR